ncbi:hypothetical protein DFJ77DRAFT_458479 [Powellomyces hirtus]|nr:hypothetical protein DFJ77DRAFT_458479 [Powellomyces hirtus]
MTSSANNQRHNDRNAPPHQSPPQPVYTNSSSNGSGTDHRPQNLHLQPQHFASSHSSHVSSFADSPASSPSPFFSSRLNVPAFSHLHASPADSPSSAQYSARDSVGGSIAYSFRDSYQGSAPLSPLEACPSPESPSIISAPSDILSEPRSSVLTTAPSLSSLYTVDRESHEEYMSMIKQRKTSHDSIHNTTAARRAAGGVRASMGPPAALPPPSHRRTRSKEDPPSANIFADSRYGVYTQQQQPQDFQQPPQSIQPPQGQNIVPRHYALPSPKYVEMLDLAHSHAPHYVDPSLNPSDHSNSAPSIPLPAAPSEPMHDKKPQQPFDQTTGNRSLAPTTSSTPTMSSRGIGGLFVTDPDSPMPLFSGHLYKLGRNKRWQWRLLRFDGQLLTCLSSTKIKVSKDATTAINASTTFIPIPNSQPMPLLNNHLLAHAHTLSDKGRDGNQWVHLPKWTIHIGSVTSISLIKRTKQGRQYSNVPMGSSHPSSPPNRSDESNPPKWYGTTKVFVIRTNEAKNYVLRANRKDDLERWLFVLVGMWRVTRQTALQQQESQYQSSLHGINMHRSLAPSIYDSMAHEAQAVDIWTDTMGRVRRHVSFVAPPQERRVRAGNHSEQSPSPQSQKTPNTSTPTSARSLNRPVSVAEQDMIAVMAASSSRPTRSSFLATSRESLVLNQEAGRSPQQSANYPASTGSPPSSYHSGTPSSSSLQAGDSSFKKPLFGQHRRKPSRDVPIDLGRRLESGDSPSYHDNSSHAPSPLRATHSSEQVDPSKSNSDINSQGGSPILSLRERHVAPDRLTFSPASSGPGSPFGTQERNSRERMESMDAGGLHDLYSMYNLPHMSLQPESPHPMDSSPADLQDTADAQAYLPDAEMESAAFIVTPIDVSIPLPPPDSEDTFEHQQQQPEEKQPRTLTKPATMRSIANKDLRHNIMQQLDDLAKDLRVAQRAQKDLTKLGIQTQTGYPTLPWYPVRKESLERGADVRPPIHPDLAAVERQSTASPVTARRISAILALATQQRDIHPPKLQQYHANSSTPTLPSASLSSDASAGSPRRTSSLINLQNTLSFRFRPNPQEGDPIPPGTVRRTSIVMMQPSFQEGTGQTPQSMPPVKPSKISDTADQQHSPWILQHGQSHDASHLQTQSLQRSSQLLNRQSTIVTFHPAPPQQRQVMVSDLQHHHNSFTTGTSGEYRNDRRSSTLPFAARPILSVAAASSAAASNSPVRKPSKKEFKLAQSTPTIMWTAPDTPAASMARRADQPQPAPPNSAFQFHQQRMALPKRMDSSGKPYPPRSAVSITQAVYDAWRSSLASLIENDAGVRVSVVAGAPPAAPNTTAPATSSPLARQDTSNTNTSETREERDLPQEDDDADRPLPPTDAIDNEERTDSMDRWISAHRHEVQNTVLVVVTKNTATTTMTGDPNFLPATTNATARDTATPSAR